MGYYAFYRDAFPGRAMRYTVAFFEVNGTKRIVERNLSKPAAKTLVASLEADAEARSTGSLHDQFDTNEERRGER